MFDLIIAQYSHSLGSGYSTSSTSKIAASQANAVLNVTFKMYRWVGVEPAMTEKISKKNKELKL